MPRSERAGPTGLHPSATVRWLLLVAGIVATALGVVGAFLPVLPTTPFLLLAAACFARASPKLDRRLTESKTFGPMIVEWRTHRAIPWRTKLVALGLMSAMIAVSATWFVEPWWAKALLVAVCVATGAWLWSIPSRDRPVRER
ncbi:MAG: YbaN family protein [Burkholderiales bacterium]|nr:YbaN family protein [Burkholderiales bacterium]